MKTLTAHTGLDGLDAVLNGLLIGDNVVWQVDDVSDYKKFVLPFVKRALTDKKKVVYIRFADHPPLLENTEKITVYKIDPESGFESFSTQIHNIATKEGEGTYYVFDCLSDLLSSWATDLMIGNFFLVTCPYLYELDTIAYFSVLRNSLSFETIARIRETTQLLLDLFNIRNTYYVHPLKVFNRYSPTMYLPHIQKGEKFIPIVSSADAANIFSGIYKKGPESEKRKLDFWDRLFIRAQELFEKKGPKEEQEKMIDQLCRVMIGKEEKMLALAKKHLAIDDILSIKSRMIGTGFIGGKSVGMLLSRRILLSDPSCDWRSQLEPHDSFYVGSDVFYTYIVQNGWWRLLMEQKTQGKYFEAAQELSEKLLKGRFPQEIKEQFQEMLEYFGQAPIIVRSSSLLEDGFGNVFAGKYESIFCANQGSPEERYKNFESSVKRIFSSTMNKDALFYRMQKGLTEQEEQMALLVQRVSGSTKKHYFFPDTAGVGISHNIFIWNKDMDPKAGMLRLVFGLGTRAVNRVEDDYPRIVALDDPLSRPIAGIEEARKYSQHKIDLLDISKNSLETLEISDVLSEGIDFDMGLIAEHDGTTNGSWILSFDPFLRTTEFAGTMQKMMKFLEAQYKHPVDIEFTANFTKDRGLQINLLQCRPLQAKSGEVKIDIPEDIDKSMKVFSSEGGFMGGSISRSLRRLIYVDAKLYSELTQSARYDIARAIGKLNHLINAKEELPTIIIGPGRWGTTTPSMGIPVSFSEINNASCLVEVSFRTANLIPEVSFGTHFFQDLVEGDIFYSALFTENKDVLLNSDLVMSFSNKLSGLLPEYGKYQDVIRVCDFEDNKLMLAADVISQKVVCFIK
ncbi:MAG: phosphoenolpyruvate synthase [Candidatus Saganbacteria bacterium]|nr:phosphoenolpyruvate synthase [Candidatus Saganbacteria bacterium]